MNYSELSQMARSQAWAADYKAAADAVNVVILRHRQAWLDAREGIGVGDFVIDGDKTLRVAHDWGDAVQLTDGIYGASFYLGREHFSFSGGLNPSIDIAKFALTEERRAGSVWFFSEDNVGAHNGYHTQAIFKVWKLVSEGTK